MTRTLTLNYLGAIYKIKIRTIPNSDHSSIVIWRDGTALTGTSFIGAMGNKEAKVIAKRMIDEHRKQSLCEMMLENTLLFCGLDKNLKAL